MLSCERRDCREDEAKEIEISRGAGGVLPLTEDVGVSAEGGEGGSGDQELEECGKEVRKGEFAG